MKNLILLSVLSLALFSCQSKDKNKDQRTEPVVMEMSIEGMTCNGCVGTVEASVKQMGEGIESVKVSLDSANAIVEYIPADVSVDEIKDAIEINGYKVLKTEEK